MGYVIYIGTMFLPDKNAAALRGMMISKMVNIIGKTPIIIGVKDNKKYQDNILLSHEVYNGFDCYAIKYPNTNLEWIIRLYDIKPIIQIIKKYGIENIHSVIVMDYMFLALNRLMRYCNKNQIKLIIDTVDWFEKSKYKFPKNIIKDIDTSIRMRYIHKKSNNMITISKYLYNYYETYVKNIIMIPSTVDNSDIKWRKLNIYKGNDVITLAYAGQPGKNFERERIDWVIKIVSELNQKGKKCNLIIAGIEKKDILNRFRKLLELPYVDTNVYFLGRISHIECLNIITTSDFSLLVRENILVNKAGFPTKLSESFACGTPVIATPSSNIHNYIINGENGFLTKDFSFLSIRKLLYKIVQLSKTKIMDMHKMTKEKNPLDNLEFISEIRKLI